MSALATAGALLPVLANAQTQPSGAPVDLGLPSGAANPSQFSSPSTIGGPAATVPSSEEAVRIDALRFRSIIGSPTETDTILDDMNGWRSKLADYGVGVNALFTASPSVNLLHQPQTTYGASRYVGQTPQFDTSNDYLALTYDLGHAGIKGGMLTLMGCDQASTAGTYGHNAHICQAYYDQQLFNKHLDIQAGIIENSFQYQNVYVGGSLSSGTLGPNATQGSQLGLSGVGVGAPAVNVAVNQGNYYVKIGVQRSSGGIHTTQYENQVGNPNGLTFSEPGQGVLYLQELGYRAFSAPGTLNTWVRFGGLENTSEFTSYAGGKTTGQGVYLFADHQFTEPDPSKPRRGLYAGANYTWTDPDVATYWEYFEARVYDIGPFASRPEDQVAFVGNVSQVSPGYQALLRKSKYGTKPQVTNLTLTYTYHVQAGIFFTSGLTYAIHPSPIYNSAQGNPLLFRGVLAAYF